MQRINCANYQSLFPKPIIVTSNYQSINKREGDQPKVMYFVVAEEATREPIACQTE